MCCAQTAAPEGEKMIVGKSMHGFSAVMNALRSFTGGGLLNGRSDKCGTRAVFRSLSACLPKGCIVNTCEVFKT